MVEKVKKCVNKIQFTQQSNGFFTSLALQINHFSIYNKIKKKQEKKTNLMFLSAFFGGCKIKNVPREARIASPISQRAGSTCSIARWASTNLTVVLLVPVFG